MTPLRMPATPAVNAGQPGAGGPEGGLAKHQHWLLGLVQHSTPEPSHSSWLPVFFMNHRPTAAGRQGGRWWSRAEHAGVHVSGATAWDIAGAQVALQAGGEDLMDEGQRLAVVPEQVLAAPERPCPAKLPAGLNQMGRLPWGEPACMPCEGLF